MINVAILGSGFMGKTHADGYKTMQNAKVVAIFDKDVNLGENFAEQYNCKHYSDFEKMVEDCDIDVVDICLPTFLHEEYVIAAAKHKKNIFCEKPITLSVKSLDKMLNEVTKNNVNLYVGQVLHFWKEYVKAKELYDTGKLGDLRYIQAARLSQHPKWSQWYKKAENSGGGLFDLHLHDIDYLCWLLGKVESVYACGVKNEYDCWNYVSSILNFESGISALAEGVIEMEDGYPFTMELKLVGTKQTFEYIMKAGENLENIGESKRQACLFDDGNIEKLSFEEENAYFAELKHFVDCVEKGIASNIVETEKVRDVLCTLEALKLSLETKDKVTVDYSDKLI